LNSSSYDYASANDLNVLQTVALLMADCLGTGLLVLPQDVLVIGKVIDLSFLIISMLASFSHRQCNTLKMNLMILTMQKSIQQWEEMDLYAYPKEERLVIVSHPLRMLLQH
jgi:hypothetical protein